MSIDNSTLIMQLQNTDATIIQIKKTEYNKRLVNYILQHSSENSYLHYV